MRHDLIAHGTATAGVAATLVIFLLLAPTSPGTGSSFLTTSSFAPTASGLELHISLNATSIASGQSVSVTVWVYNPSTSEAEVNYSGSWALQGLSVGPCGVENYPMGFVVMRGNLSMGQVKDGEPLQLYATGAYACPMILFSIQGYVFSPSSSVASVMGSCTPSSCFSSNQSASMTFSGDYGLLGFRGLAPGFYTVVGGDEWGALTILHFAVTS